MSSVRDKYGAETNDSLKTLASHGAILVLPHERTNGFWANIRGHVLDLADPDTGYGLAPNPDDLFVVSIASELAWTARRILRGSRLPDDVNVAAIWRATADPATLADIDLTITVSGRAKAASAVLAAAVDNSLAARSLVQPVARISWEGANR
jgi:uncharacterized OsmC-like protein